MYIYIYIYIYTNTVSNPTSCPKGRPPSSSPRPNSASFSGLNISAGDTAERAASAEARNVFAAAFAPR